MSARHGDCSHMSICPCEKHGLCDEYDTWEDPEQLIEEGWCEEFDGPFFKEEDEAAIDRYFDEKCEEKYEQIC